ncbi:MAG: outer membrane protein assembly factor BamA [Methylococcaceae bacterium]|nr:outer membrane protein assembly factor BamA [Methylococcaceae bacterium]
MRLQKILILSVLLCLCQQARGVDSFIVEDIRVEGLERISEGTVFNYLPVQIGDRFDLNRSADAIRALFKPGFFKDVRLSQVGNVLVVTVVERPAIASIELKGNKDLKSDDLLKALKDIGLKEGQVFNRQTLDKVEQELRRQYFSRGKYAVKVDSKVTSLKRNRVAIEINISEGTVARIRQINIVGNQVFQESELLDLFEIGASNLLSFYTKNDQYSKQKLSADLERLRSHYLDRGHINFTIESTQVSITPDKKEIYITVNIKEGPVFALDEVRLSGNLVVDPDQLIPLVQTNPGDIFSRKSATETSQAITERLGDEGYAFANVNMVPDINTEKRTVKLTFFVDPGKRVFVRRVNIKGNTKTRDEVVRRELRQMEAAWASTSKIERSKTRLERLGYFETVNVETPAVPDTPDQIDVDYAVEEKSAGNLSAGVGFSQVQGLIVNASVIQDNVLGTGKRINFTFNNSSVTTIYQLGYLNPYFTLDGISSGYNISYIATNGQQANISRYSNNEFVAGLNFGIPLNEFDSLRLNLDFKRTRINTFSNSPCEIRSSFANGANNPICGTPVLDSSGNQVFTPVLDSSGNPVLDSNGTPVVTPVITPRIIGFVDENGDTFTSFPIAIGWSHDTRDKAVFATEGGVQSLQALATIPGLKLEYYKVSYRTQYFFPIASDFTLSLNADLGYGNSYGKIKGLPFFENFYAGGPQSVRGFLANTLGPLDSNRTPFGGNTKVVGSAELYFPVPFAGELESVRLAGFVDAGNVFDNSISLSGLRYAAGLSAEWLSPFGALKVSVAQPFNQQPGDRIQRFQFSFGSGF